MPPASLLVADKGYDSDEFREALAAREIKACFPPRRNRNTLHYFDRQVYKTRHKIENMFDRLKDWRRISTHFDRCAYTFFSAICIAAAFIFYLNQCVLNLGRVDKVPSPETC